MGASPGPAFVGAEHQGQPGHRATDADDGWVGFLGHEHLVADDDDAHDEQCEVAHGVEPAAEAAALASGFAVGAAPGGALTAWRVLPHHLMLAHRPAFTPSVTSLAMAHA